MPQTNTIKVQRHQTPGEQGDGMRITLPKHIAEFLDVEAGDRVRFDMATGSKATIEKVTE